MDDGLYQTEIARILDVDECTIHFWENDKTKIRITYYPRIIVFLGYHPFSENPNTIPDIVRIHREKLGLSIKEFAKILSVDPETVKRYERNKISKYSRVRKIFELEIPELGLIKMSHPYQQTSAKFLFH